jgi:hypothetical protein
VRQEDYLFDREDTEQIGEVEQLEQEIDQTDLD